MQLATGPYLYGNADVAFTSDTHAFHANIIKYSNRPFANVDDMNKILALNINATLKNGGTLYHLGDWAFAGLESSIKFRQMVRPDINIKIILGNHDHHVKHKQWRDLFSSIDKLSTVKVNGQSIVLCHYPLLTWDKAHYGVWHLFGHCHNNLAVDIYARRLDVGVDGHTYRPWTFNEIKNIMENERQFKPVDHHKV